MSNQKAFIDAIKINDSLKEIDLTNLKKCEANAFVLCKYSLINYEKYINRFMNKQITKDEIQLINQNSPKFQFTLDEIMSFINKINIYIVDSNYLIDRGINQIFLNDCNLSYYIHNGIKYLYFNKEFKLFKIDQVKVMKLPNQNDINNSINNNLTGSVLPDMNNDAIINSDNTNNTNNNINNINNNTIINNNNNNLNDNKVIILRCLILFYGNERIIKQRLSLNIQNGEIFKCNLVNKDFINNLKNKFYYSTINNILSTNDYNYDNFNDYLQYLETFQSMPEIKNILKNINDIDSINNIRILPEKNKFTNNNEYKWPINFELIHEELFKMLLNIYKKSENEMNEIKTYQSQYKIYFGYSTLYINYLNNPIYFFAYNYDINNNSYNLFAVIKNDGNIFDGLYSKHLISMTFKQYLNQKKIDKNKINIFQPIINSQNQIILQVLLYNKELKENIITNNFKILFQIFQNYKKFIKSLNQQTDNNIIISSIDDIKNNINFQLMKFLKVYIIKNDQLKYCFNILRFNELYKYEKSNDATEKENIMNNINAIDISHININLEILQPQQLNQDSNYSFIDEIFCQQLKLSHEKYKPFEVIYFINQNNRFLYFKNNLLLKVINYKDNSFKLSKYDFNNNNINTFDSNIINTNIVFNNIMKIDNIENNTITGIKLRELDHCLGLENIGATCYMNATIQCLCHIRSLKEYFKNNNNFNDKARLTKCFCELINSLWTESNKGYFTPTNFKNLISELNPLFQGIQANDSKDLIIFIYETIHNELNNPSENNNYLNNLNNIPEELKLFRESYYAKNNSIISKIFYSEQSSNLKCSSCGVNKLSFNIISFLIFPLEKVRQQLIKQKNGNLIYVTLEDCFEQNENKEKLFGANQIFCNSCHRSSDAVSYNRLYNCPEVLTIILNRGKGLEFDVEFKFPMYINIQKYVEEKNSNTNYELIGLITHLGESGMSGHFIAYCKSPVNNNWYCFNDSQVTKCVNPENEINSCGIPYVLFYQKVNLSIPITYDKTPEDVVKDNTNNKKGFVLYFTYEGKEGYIELNGDDLFQNVINKIYTKYEWVPRTGVEFLLQRNNDMAKIERYQTISQNGLKYGEKIIIA